SALHEGLEEWYQSRCRDGEDTGEANIERALEAANTYWGQRAGELEDPDLLKPAMDETSLILRRYHDWYGPGGKTPEYPQLKVLFDDAGEPMIERYFEVKLPGMDPYTVRTDLIAQYNQFIVGVDHKSSKASWVKQLLLMAQMDAQFTGELAGLREETNLPLNGILINVLVKDRKTGPPFERELVNRTDAEIEVFKHHVAHDFDLVDRFRAEYERLLTTGVDNDTAFNLAYPQWGKVTGHCTAYYRRCEYWGLCQTATVSGTMIESTYRPRSKRDVRGTGELGD
ncbi:hypothetical protein LCGC14_3119650, partial [marine sediment metagenome]